MTSSQDLIARAITEIESRPGYNYNREILEQTIAAGHVPDGTVLRGGGGGPTLLYYADEARVVENGKIVKTAPMTDAMREQALLTYAKSAARRGHSVGSM